MPDNNHDKEFQAIKFLVDYFESITFEQEFEILSDTFEDLNFDDYIE